MAVRISKVIGGTPESWLHMQEAVDLWEVEQRFKSNPAIAPITMKPLMAAAIKLVGLLRVVSAPWAFSGAPMIIWIWGATQLAKMGLAWAAP
jgi:hypothetical protein